MNKNKIIFLIIGIIIVIFFVVVFFILSSAGKDTKTNSKTKNFVVWILQDDKTKFNDFLNDFKSKNEKYKSTNFNIISFSNYEEYYNSLMGAFLRGEVPDIFTLNNNDSNFFDTQILGIDPALISPDNFRNTYDTVFSNDLIRKIKVDDKDVEYLVGIPLGYENLGIFYNFRELKGKKVSTWSYINEIVRELRSNNKVGIGIGNGSAVYTSEDIITQFFLLDGMKDLKEVQGNNMKSSISNYVRFGDIAEDNKYNGLFVDFTNKNKNDLDAFSAGDVQMIIGYPRLIEEIDKKGFNKNFLRAEVFPTYNEDKGNLLVNYNYFVINKNSQNIQAAQDLLVYFSSKDGQEKYLELFNYYFPSMISLLSSRLEENIKDGYNIKYGNFNNQALELTSFNKGVKTLYDKEIVQLLNNGTNSIELFEFLRKKVLCISNKIISSETLEVSCE